MCVCQLLNASLHESSWVDQMWMSIDQFPISEACTEERSCYSWFAFFIFVDERIDRLIHMLFSVLF